MSIRAKVALSPAQAKASAALSHYGSRTTEPTPTSATSSIVAIAAKSRARVFHRFV